ncbi:putative cuticle protein [Penaeus vannamei]|uniref:Putative cuticle protein n=1 Tax=Penaeus vannamei TaxID=6689 RepID=A0A3R7MBL4_PENVA|nr:putative cuticle protein [Penaeus vannamei]
MDERDPVDNYGGYGFRFRTGNRISFSESAAPSGPLRKIVTKGSVSFHHPDGTLHHLTYTADENGYRPVSDMIPTPYPLLPWQVTVQQLRFPPPYLFSASSPFLPWQVEQVRSLHLLLPLPLSCGTDPFPTPSSPPSSLFKWSASPRESAACRSWPTPGPPSPPRAKSSPSSDLL